MGLKFSSDAFSSQWLNESYPDTNKLKTLKDSFKSSKPFQFLELPDFLRKEKAASVLNALSKEKFYEKESDIFKFRQTNDLAGTRQKMLKEFRDFLYSEEFISFMEHLTGFKLKNTADMAGTIYQDNAYLFCHPRRPQNHKKK